MRYALLWVMLLSLFWTGCRKNDRLPGQVPPLSLKTYSGQDYSLSTNDSMVTALVFWATWCQPCLMEIPELVQLQKKYRDRGFRVVAVNVDDPDGNKVRPIEERFGINYTVLIGTDQIAQDYGGIYALPTLFLIGRDGKLKEKLMGLESPEELEQKVVAEL